MRFRFIGVAVALAGSVAIAPAAVADNPPPPPPVLTANECGPYILQTGSVWAFVGIAMQQAVCDSMQNQVPPPAPEAPPAPAEDDPSQPR